MAIATPSRIVTHIAAGLGHKATVRAPLKGLGCYMQPHRHSVTIRSKSEPTERSRKGTQYQKELYCYADQLYRNRDYFWISLWAQYYSWLKRTHGKLVMGSTKHKKTYEFDAKKDVGRHALWLKTICKDLLPEFNDRYVKAQWVITELKVENNTLSFVAHLTNLTDEEASLKYFDINLLRLLGRT